MEQLWRGIILCVGVLIGTYFVSTTFSTERYMNNRELYEDRLRKIKEKETKNDKT